MRDAYKAQDRVGQRHAPAIRKALAAAWSIPDILEAWRHTAPSNVWTRQEAAAWIRLHIHFKNDQLSKALTNLWAEGTVFGKDLADHSIQHVKRGRGKSVDKAPTFDFPSTFDWANWTAGNRAAAVLLNPQGGLARRLADRNLVLQGLSDTTANRIGTILSDGLKEGLSPHAVRSDVAGALIDAREDWADTLEGRLLQLADDQRRAEVIARTEMNQAVVDEKTERYNDMGVSRWTWVVVDPCEICSENDGVTVDMGDEFPSGDTEPLVHPNCNCDLMPDLSEFTDGEDDMEEKGLAPDVEPIIASIGIPSILEVKRAISRLEILPNPADPSLKNAEKFVMSPWTHVDVPTIDPNIWDQATVQLVDMEDLFGTDPFLKRKNVLKHIERMGQAERPFRSFAMVYECADQQIIVDGHHRLMSLWLLGLDKAPVWLVKDNH